MISVGIIGVGGYAGQELVRLIQRHQGAKLQWVTSNTYADRGYHTVYGNYAKIYEEACLLDNIEVLIEAVDVVFMAGHPGMSSAIVTKELLEKVVVIDLSGDYRFANTKIYEEWYGITHASPQVNELSTYGLSELNRDSIMNRKLIANPGCYPTCTVLSLYPLLKQGLIDPDTIIVDAKSGVSGAGRIPKLDTHYNEVNENIKAYGIGVHKHTPEIEEQLSQIAGKTIKISFTPHLIPMQRGILTTTYAQLTTEITEEQIRAIYQESYQDMHFIRVLEKGFYPETKWVEGSNYVDINFKFDARTNRIVVVGAIDNLVKGAAGQAVQNMNIHFGLAENIGLDYIPLFP